MVLDVDHIDEELVVNVLIIQILTVLEHLRVKDVSLQQILRVTRFDVRGKQSSHCLNLAKQEELLLLKLSFETSLCTFTVQLHHFLPRFSVMIFDVCHSFLQVFVKIISKDLFDDKRVHFSALGSHTLFFQTME